MNSTYIDTPDSIFKYICVCVCVCWLWHVFMWGQNGRGRLAFAACMQILCFNNKSLACKRRIFYANCRATLQAKPLPSHPLPPPFVHPATSASLSLLPFWVLARRGIRFVFVSFRFVFFILPSLFVDLTLANGIFALCLYLPAQYIPPPSFNWARKKLLYF